MKSFLLTILAIFCLAFLILGNMYWQEKTAVSSYKASPTEPSEEPSSSEEDRSEEKDSDVDLFAKWPEKAQADFKAARESGETYKLAIVGSPALGKGENGWSEQLKASLEENYGKTLDVKIFQNDTISINFIVDEGSDEVIAYAPDMVLYEPFSLNDNSRGVLVGDNHDSIDVFLSDLREVNEDVVLLLQPTHPLYRANYYPGQVEELKVFAEESKITYLDHWEAWPEDESLLDLLLESKAAPSEEGHRVWAEYLKNYFIHKE
ncbi:SGNH/GDSL hydrolase family protein [Rossellomorea aquimaris]|uniref:SGNH/GDSL hydrolase family protein n=1 Tax=Rossellomorea aquimaris TaxID=189382 RepID=UPI0007D079EC|nr:SGNH/GDSL hydrolase family protein [Rossellomorea aquimaris]